jgi:hypothetical protein
VHEEEVDIGDWNIVSFRPCLGFGSGDRTVADEEGLVAGGHQVAGLPVGSVSDLSRNRQPVSPIFSCNLAAARGRVSSSTGAVQAVRTLGIAAWPLKRLRTRLSIPLGLRHEGSTPVRCQTPASSYSSSV